MRHRYTEEQIGFIKSNCDDLTNEELTEAFNKIFDCKVSINSIVALKRKNKFCKITRYNFTKEQIDFIKENYSGVSNRELTEKFNEKFNLNLPKKKIKSIKCTHHLSNGDHLLFKKGHIPWNKGTKGLMPPSNGSNGFKKGHINWNTRPIFSERINIDGYVEIKISKSGKWELKHRYIYEQKHGEIPKEHRVIFADGNKFNFDVGNLILASNSEFMTMISMELYAKNPEITKTGLTLAKVLIKMKKIKNKRSKKKC